MIVFSDPIENNQQKIIIFWFRRDLRLEDNHGLYQALSVGIPVVPIFIFDENIIQTLPEYDARISFIYKQLSNIQSRLAKLNSSLILFKGKPLDAFQYLINKYNVVAVYTNHDYEPYAIQRDTCVSNLLKSKSIEFKTFKDQVIYEKNEILNSVGYPYTVFTPYSKKWREKFSQEQLISYPSDKLLNKIYKTTNLSFPTLKDIGFNCSSIVVSSNKIDGNIIKNYHKTRDIPSINGTSKLSVHLRFGTISIRKLVKIANEFNQTFLNELIWREFFMMILYHFPQVVNHSFRPEYDNIKWLNNEQDFEKWCKGETGYPIVDAGMRELNTTGFMHNRVRMIVASFLTKHLLIDWRWGESYFAQKLLDYELSSNNGNWQWAAGTGCDAAPYFRIFNPYEQTKRFDPELKYITQWLGDIKNYKILPIVEHRFARQRAIEFYKRHLQKL